MNDLILEELKAKVNRDSHIDPIIQELQSKERKTRKPKIKGNALGQILKGGSWGFSDEAGGVGTVIGAKLAGNDKPISELYTQGRDRIRAENKAYEKDNFWSSMGLQAVGAAPSGIAAGGKFLASKFAAPLANMTKNAIIGGTGGFTAGAGLSEADSVGGVLTDAAQGLAVGSTVGVLAPPILGKVGSGASYLANSLTNAFTAPTKRSNRVINQYLNDAGITNQQQLNNAVKDIDNPLLADVSESTRQLTDAISQQTGSGRDIIKPVLEGRKKESISNIVNGLEKTTGKNAGYYESADLVEAKMKELAKPLYDEAYSVHTPFTSDLKNIFGREATQEAFMQAKKMADAKGIKLPELYRFNNATGKLESTGQIPDTQSWDSIKRGLDAMIEKETGEFGKVSSLGNAYVKLKNELLGKLDAINPKYAEARKIWSGGSSFLDAMAKGKRILLENNYISSKDFNAMSAADREGYLLGAMNQIREKVELMPENANVTLRQMFTAPEMKRRLENAFPNKEGYKEFMRIISSEGKKAETNRVIFGSQTNMRGQHQERLGLDVKGETMQLADGNLASVARLADQAMKSINKLPPEAQEEIARALISPANLTPKGVFLDSKPPKYLKYLLDPQLGKAAELTGKGLLGYSSGNYSSK